MAYLRNYSILVSTIYAECCQLQLLGQIQQYNLIGLIDDIAGWMEAVVHVIT